MKKLNVLFLAGAGGVGKTSLSNALLKVGPEFNIITSIVGSTTRASYAKHGLSSEADALNLDTEARLNLQRTIMEDYGNNLIENVKAHKNTDTQLLVIDRSPYDHASYVIQNNPQIELDKINKIISQANSIIKQVKSLSETESLVHIDIQFLPFPTPWSSSSKIEDGFRYVPAGKNFIWSLCLKQLIEEQIPALTYFSSFKNSSNDTPEERANVIMHKLYNK